MGDKVKVPVVPDMETEDVVASASAPSGNGQTFGKVEVGITKVRRAKPILWTGDDENRAKDYIDPLKRNQFVQAMRAVVNEMEMDVCAEAIMGAMAEGNILGTAGTNPFTSNLNVLTAAHKLLQDKGAPLTDLQFVMNTAAGMYMRNLTQLQKVNEGGNDDLLRRGLLGNLFGFNIRESAGFMENAKGAGTGYLVNGAVSAGATEVTVDTGSGAIKAGNIVTFGSDNTKYVVAEDVASGGTKIKLVNALEKDVADDATVTVGNSYLPCAAFSGGSIVLANRLPLVPEDGDIAIDRTTIVDPVSGITFELALWGGAYQNSITIATAWGVKNIKGRHSVAILG